MFPFQQSDEYSFQISHNPQHENIAEEDLVLGSQVDQRKLINFVGEGKQPHETFGASNSNNSNAISSNDEKKIFHKEIERQRRQQMSTLHASLRSLLPLELIKGKRSMSDHLNGAVNYIQYLKNNIRDLSVKRDKLKRLSNSTNFVEDQGSESSENAKVSVRPYLNGAEIVITSDYEEEGFVLSKLLEAVLEEGLDFDSCASSKKDGRLYTIIHCQASNDMGCIDQAGLQRKLNDVILCLKCNAEG